MSTRNASCRLLGCSTNKRATHISLRTQTRRARGFLLAPHIARWSDNEQFRGHMGTGFCFCLIHDKAFEVGLYTIHKLFAVFVNPPATVLDSSKRRT